MPNWCSGNIRFRGKIDDIIRLLENELELYGPYDKNGEHPSIPFKVNSENKEWELILSPSKESESKDPLRSPSYYFYIKDTSRNFLNLNGGCEVEAHVWTLDGADKDEERVVVFFSDFDAAWCIEPEPYAELSKKYNVDIRIFGYECGMGFAQEIEVVNGAITKNLIEDYRNGKSWGWDCPFPTLGG